MAHANVSHQLLLQFCDNGNPQRLVHASDAHLTAVQRLSCR
jgi:hypothetical protein